MCTYLTYDYGYKQKFISYKQNFYLYELPCKR